MSYLRPRRHIAQHWTALGLAALMLGLGNAPVLQAENMRSDSYIIQFGNFNVTSGEKSGGGFKVTDTVGQTAAGQFAAAGFTVSSGFQYVYAIPRFTFQIKGLDIDLGNLLPGSFAEAQNQLQITTRSGGYTILAAADHELRTSSNDAIPHTACDSMCTFTLAGQWNNPERAGFGFNVTGVHRASDFLDSSYFRPFADRETTQLPQTIAGHYAIVKDDSVTVTYKAAIPDSQASGEYQTVIDYIAVPTY